MGIIFLLSASITEKYDYYTPIGIILVGCASLINGLGFLKDKEQNKHGKSNIIFGIFMVCIGCIVLGMWNNALKLMECVISIRKGITY